MPIPENVIINGDGTFSLTERAVGTVTMSGVADQTTLLDVVTWGQTRLTGISSLDHTYDRATSPDVSCWITNQQSLTEFLSDICAFFTHLYYIKSGTLYLVDMFIENGSSSVTEYEYFSADYSIPTLIGQIIVKWTTYSSEEGFVDEVRTAQYIKATENTAVASLYQTVSGTADGTTANRLIDSGATFTSVAHIKIVKIGYVVQNTTDNTSTIVLSVVSDTELLLADDIFVSGEDYSIGPAMPYANDIDVTPFHDTRANIEDALQNILLIVNKDSASIRIPMESTLPDPGKKITFPDTSLRVNTSTYIYTRDLSFDFLNEEIVIDGEGVVA